MIISYRGHLTRTQLSRLDPMSLSHSRSHSSCRALTAKASRNVALPADMKASGFAAPTCSDVISGELLYLIVATSRADSRRYNLLDVSAPHHTKPLTMSQKCRWTLPPSESGIHRLKRSREPAFIVVFKNEASEEDYKVHLRARILPL